MNKWVGIISVFSLCGITLIILTYLNMRFRTKTKINVSEIAEQRNEIFLKTSTNIEFL